MMWYLYTMKTTIDKAGRVVIPSGIRRRAGLKPGSDLRIEFTDGCISIVRDVPGPELVRRAGRLVAKPSGKDLPEIDLADWVARERDRWPL